MMPALIFFDLDGTLAASKQALTPEMAGLLAELLEHTKVAIISGGALAQFLEQVVAQLPAGAQLENLYLLPTSGAALYEYMHGGWKKIYEEALTHPQVAEVEAAMRAAARETHLIDLAHTGYGERIEYRGGQVSLSALGQHAPLAAKQVWDPEGTKRHVLQRAIAAKLPDYSVHMGGLTTIDVNKEGIDKAYGIRKLCERLHIAEGDALYVGDQLEPGGNDEAAFKTSVATHAVATLGETAALIRSLLGEAG